MASGATDKSTPAEACSVRANLKLSSGEDVSVDLLAIDPMPQHFEVERLHLSHDSYGRPSLHVFNLTVDYGESREGRKGVPKVSREDELELLCGRLLEYIYSSCDREVFQEGHDAHIDKAREVLGDRAPGRKNWIEFQKRVGDDS